MRLIATIAMLVLSASALADKSACKKNKPTRYDEETELRYEKDSDKLYTGSICINHQMEGATHILWMQWNFVDGKRHGPSYEYFSDGTIMKETSWANGVGDGTSTQWSDKGTKRREEIWIDGDFMYENGYSSRGHLSTRYMFVRSPGFDELAAELSAGHDEVLPFTIIRTHFDRNGEVNFQAGLYNKATPDGSFRNMQGPLSGNRPWRGSNQGLHSRWHNNGKKRSEGFFVNGTLMRYDAWEDNARPICHAERASADADLVITNYDQYGDETDEKQENCKAF